MYAAHFGLNEHPFNNTHDPRFFFSTPDHEAALASLIYTVGELKGLTLLTGEAGTGKTFLSRLMLAHFGDRIAFAELGRSPMRSDDLVTAICLEFGLEIRPEEGRAKAAEVLQEFLIDQYAANRPAVLVLDDAHCLPPGALEQLRAINNIESNDAKLLQIVLMGQPELVAMLNHPTLRQLRQRCFRACQLPPLCRQQTDGYIDNRLTLAGAAVGRVFDREAMEVIHEISRGVPRMINTLCDNVLLSAYSSDASRIDPALIRKVAAQTMTLHLPFADYPLTWFPDDVATAPNDSIAIPNYAAPPPARRATAADPTLVRIAQVEQRIAELTVAAEHPPNPPVASVEAAIAVQLASIDQRIAELAGHVDGNLDAGRQNRRLAERLAHAESKLIQLKRQDQENRRHAEEHARQLQLRAESRLAQSRREADLAVQRIKTQMRNVEKLATSLNHAAAESPPTPASRITSKPPTRAIHRVDAGNPVAEPIVQRLRLRADAAFARPIAARQLVDSIRGLTRLASNAQYDLDAADSDE